ncbi:hypothetical protein RI129_006082 [Pyrocoelia pectoralis]|uniref:Uncharacterized protein n=1 Tax=Pyrocoelia pectoralis TaxID=417401 RepID=A0AAN7ZJH0_9COLE
MSNSSPDQVYGYLNPAINYRYDDPEGYMSDYPDSDVLSERSHAIPPLNGIKTRIAHPAAQELYACDLYHSPENFYYETLHPVPSSMRRPGVPFAYRRSIPLVDDRGQYYTPPMDADFRDHAKMPPRIGRRHSVAVRTPRYIRRTMNNVCKKPSALCLPIACQLDPGMYRRSKRHQESPCHYCPNTHIPAGKHLSRRHILARYDTIYEDHYPKEKCGSVSSRSSKMRKFKPKTPPSLKKENEKNKSNGLSSTKPEDKNKNSNKQPNIDSLEVEEITTEVLDSMLSELMNSGCGNKLNEDNAKENRSKSPPKTYDSRAAGEGATIKNVQETSKPLFASFNYQDISKNIAKSKTISPSTPKSSKGDITNVTLKNSKCDTPVSDDNGIMELHRSKSYIVNLIDRALSRELGTPTDEIYPPVPKEIAQVNARQASGTIRKHDRKCDNGLCLEVTPNLADSVTSNGGSTENEVKHEISCTCNVQEEPMYIKQLRQLRWGHLRHIQMEVRRLEDLERFLDSCSSQQSK